ncbi:hypothetical protein P4K96_04270 [Bacillus cereus]|nr:hypothetical protein [Bacillus cereus]
MRNELAAMEGKRCIFIATFVKISAKKAHTGTGLTALLYDIKTKEHEPLADHVWLDYNDEIAALNLHEGETIIFKARVSKYVKGLHGHIEDYKLMSPSQIQRIEGHHFKGRRRKRAKKKSNVQEEISGEVGGFEA